MPLPQIASERTVCFLLKGDTILLSKKKRGQGVGNYNGYGGGLEPEETHEAAAVRELREESTAIANPADLEHRATLEFYFPYKPELSQRVRVYFLRTWQGEPAETEEMMKPEPFGFDNMPYDKMWDSDKRWLPLLLDGKRIKASFTWKEDNKTVDSYTIDEI